MASKPYNGHPSWNAWNVSLWISNDEDLYNWAMYCLKKHGGKIYRSTTCFLTSVGEGSKTPDGAKYSRNSVRLALIGLKD